MDAYEYMTQAQRDPYKFAALEDDAPPRKRRHRQRDVSIGRDGKPGQPVADIHRTMGLDQLSRSTGESWEERMLRRCL